MDLSFADNLPVKDMPWYFFTSVLIICIVYFLQSDGLIYAVIIALVAELINIFLTHTITKSVENKMKTRHRRAVEGYVKRIKLNKKRISELEDLQEKAADKIYKANTRIKELEEELEESQTKIEEVAKMPEDAIPPSTPKPEASQGYENHLPDGSKKKPPRT